MNEPTWVNSWFLFFKKQANALGLGLQHEFLGYQLWQYLAYLILVGLGSWLGLKIMDIVQRGARRFLHQHQEHFSSRLIERLMLPLKFAIGVTLVVGGLRLFGLSKTTTYMQDQILIVAWGACVTLAIIRLVEVFLWRWKLRYKQTHNENLNTQLFLMVDKGIKLFVVITFGLMTLHNLGINITSLLASLSIGSLALALASQDTLANLFGAVSILADNTFRVGDTIRIGDVEGAVELIGLRSTLIRNSDGYLVTIPNKNMGSALITNISQRKNRKATLQFHLDYDCSAPKIEKAKELLTQAFRSDPGTEDLIIYLQKFADHWLTIEVVHNYKLVNEKNYREAMHQIYLKLKDAFDKEGINFAVPGSSVFIVKKSIDP